jgi:hypothetical protein
VWDAFNASTEFSVMQLDKDVPSPLLAMFGANGDDTFNRAARLERLTLK